MEADWEVEVGGGAPVIDALWSGLDGAAGFVDLRAHPERIVEIEEAANCAPLAKLLLALNAAQSSVWTSKCDVWEPESGALALYLDVLPLTGEVFAELRQAEDFCRQVVRNLESAENSADGSVELVIRQAIAGENDGFGVTAYLNAQGLEALAATMAGFADTVALWKPAANPD